MGDQRRMNATIANIVGKSELMEHIRQAEEARAQRRAEEEARRQAQQQNKQS